MKVFRQLVVGVDFSPHSEVAVREACRLQHGAHTGIAAVHVLDRGVVRDLEAHTSLTEPTVRDQAQQRLEHWVEQIAGEGHPLACEAVVGHPFDGIVHAVERHHADLLVLGSRGLTTGAGHPGAVAAKCLRRAPVDVLLVRQHHREAFRHIVACVDFSPTSARVAAVAASLAHAEGAQLDLLHVHVPVTLGDLSIDPFPPAESAELMKVRAEIARRHLDEFVASLDEETRAAKPRPILATWPGATDGIVEHLRGTGADLVVLGTRGRSGLKFLLLGTTAERLVHEAPCSVLVVKPVEEQA
jgi:nucleotide-binding universal stress UspA family protein